MTSLFADGWFYISAGGFLVSSVLFAFLLGQYRAAVEAEDEAEAAAPALAPSPIKVVEPAKPAEVVAPKTVVAEPKAEKTQTPPPVASAPTPAAAPAPKAAPVRKSETTTTGGISPAVVYMQNLKLQIDHLDKEIVALKSLASQHAAQSEAILKRLTEVGERVEKAAVAPAADNSQTDAILQRLAELAEKVEKVAVAPVLSAAAAAPQPASVAVEPAPAPVAVQPSPVVVQPEPAPVVVEPQPAAEQTSPPIVEPALVIDPAEIGAAAATVELKPAELPAPQEAPAEPKPARKGPVWPI